MTIASGQQALAADILRHATANGYLELTASTELTIATGAVTQVTNFHRIDTEADAATDTLDTITAAADVTDGYLLWLRPESSARTVIISHNTGNILCADNRNIYLDDTHSVVCLVYDGNLTKWMASAAVGEKSFLFAPSTGEDIILYDFARTNARFTVTDEGMALVNDSANAKMTQGLTINQGASDDEILAFKSSDVAQGATDRAEADTFGHVRKQSGVAGGLEIAGFEDGAAVGVSGLVLAGTGTTVDTVHGAGGYGVVAIQAFKRSGTAQVALGTNGNILSLHDATTTRFVFDAEGSAFADVEWTTFDAQDDIALLEGLEMAFRDPVKDAFGEFVGANRKRLQELKVVNFYDDGPRAMVNFTRLSMLLVGAIRQLHAKTDARLARLEQLLLPSA